MKRILMLLTSHRLDCLRLSLGRLDRTDSFRHFDRVVFLLNGVEGRHLRFVNDFIAAHPTVAFDTVAGPRGRSERISELENRCVQRHPDAVYVKMDEDIFIGEGWAPRLFSAYEAHAADPSLALVTPLIPNNAFGLYQLLTRYYPELQREYEVRFGFTPSPKSESETWAYGSVAELATRKFIRIDAANAAHRVRHPRPEYLRFSERFSVGCVCFDYRHWKDMGGIPPKDEPEWCAWIRDHGRFNVLDDSQIVLHYSFFVQQDWLDRTHLLEDIRRANLPESLPPSARLRYYAPWLLRVARQVPGVIARRIRP